MPEVIAPVPVFDITVPRGADRIVRFTLTKDGVNVDLSLPGTQLIFTAKRNDDDVVPVLQKSYVASGTTAHLSPDPGGIAASHLDTDGDSILDLWVADVALTPADTEDVEDGLLSYDLWLFDPSGQEAPCAQGTLRLVPTVLRP